MSTSGEAPLEAVAALPAATARRRRVALRRLVLGDWTRLVRDPIDLLRLAVAVGAVLDAIFGQSGDAVRLAANALMVWFPRWLNLPRPFDLGYVLAIMSWGFGDVGDLFSAWAPYDKLSHFATYVFDGPLVYAAFVRLRTLPDPVQDTRWAERLRAFVVVFAISSSAGALFEILEYLVDLVGARLGTGYVDTVRDLMANAAGALVGAALLVAWGASGRVLRRAPGLRG